MTPAPPAGDLRGAARLAIEATTGVADLVEAVHARVQRLPGFTAATPDGRTNGITGLVYRSVRGVTRLVGGSLDALLGVLGPALDDRLAGAERDAVVAALNGVLGDHLAATHNPLATPMTLYHGGRPLSVQPGELAAQLSQAGPRLLVLVHGLCMNHRQWQRQGHDHGAALASAHGYTPVYLRYNSGLPVAANGSMGAGLIDTLVAAWPVPLDRLVLLGHSMGGLLLRSALHQGALAGQAWPARVDDLVCLGTPHHGAPLERAGHWIDRVLDATPYAAPFARLGRLRSAGITDLRHGALLAADRGRSTERQPVPLPGHVRCHAVAGVLGTEPGAISGRLLGDGLVPLDSALGRHPDPRHALAFEADRQWVGHGIDHMALLNHPAVAAQLQRWLA